MYDFTMKNLKKCLFLYVILFSVPKETFASSSLFQSSAPIAIPGVFQDYREEQNQDDFPSPIYFNIGTFEPVSGSWVNPPAVVKFGRFEPLDGSWVDPEQEDQTDADSIKSEVGSDEEILPCGRFERSIIRHNTLPKPKSEYFNLEESWTNPSVIQKSDKCPLPLAPVRLFTQDDVRLIAEKIQENGIPNLEEDDLPQDFDVIHKKQVVTFLLGRLKRDCKDYEIVEIFKKFEEKKEQIQFFVEAIARYINLHPNQ